MPKNARFARWLAPICLLILLVILILAMNYTTSANTLDLNTVATAVNEVNHTATAGAVPTSTVNARATVNAQTAAATAAADARAATAAAHAQTCIAAKKGPNC